MHRDAKYPEITVKLSGTDGNGMAILSKVAMALRRNEIDREEINAFMTEAMDGDYDHLLRTCMAWVDVE